MNEDEEAEEIIRRLKGPRMVIIDSGTYSDFTIDIWFTPQKTIDFIYLPIEIKND